MLCGLTYKYLESLKERGERTENKVEEIIAKNFPNLMKTINPQIQESQWVPNTRNMKKKKKTIKAHHNQIV